LVIRCFARVFMRMERYSKRSRAEVRTPDFSQWVWPSCYSTVRPDRQHSPNCEHHHPMRVRPCGLWLKPLAKRLEIIGGCLTPVVHLMLTGSSRRIREL